MMMTASSAPESKPDLPRELSKATADHNQSLFCTSLEREVRHQGTNSHPLHLSLTRLTFATFCQV